MDGIDEIEACEHRLRAAMLAGDTDELERLLGDESVFTDQYGRRLTKSDDLRAHRSGLLKVDRIDAVDDRIVRTLGNTAVVCVTVDLKGRYGGQPFAGTFAYSRMWRRSGDDWRIELAHCSAVQHDG